MLLVGVVVVVVVVVGRRERVAAKRFRRAEGPAREDEAACSVCVSWRWARWREIGRRGASGMNGSFTRVGILGV